MFGFVSAHPRRTLRLPAIVPALLRYLLNRDRGELKGRLMHALLGGLSHRQIERWRTRFLPPLLRRGLHADALARIAWHRARGDTLVLMSASPDLYVPQIGAALGFDEVICTEVRWRADVLDGRLASPNRRGTEKQHCLRQLISRYQPSRVIAYGNSDSDLAHLKLADEAYLVNGSGAALAPDCGHIERLRWRQRGGVSAV
jgi:phosphatidylglycerophosphatase C